MRCLGSRPIRAADPTPGGLYTVRHAADRTTGGRQISEGEYRMSIRRFRKKRWAVLVVAAMLGLAPMAQAETNAERRLRQLEEEV